MPSKWYTKDEMKSHLTAEQVAKNEAESQSKAKASQQQKLTQFKRDMDKLIENAEGFVKANLDKVAKRGIERMYLKQENYVGIVKLWESQLLDEDKKQSFLGIDEILVGD